MAFPGGSFEAIDEGGVHTEDAFIEEEEGAEGLILGGGGDLSDFGEVAEEVDDILVFQFGGVFHMVESEEADDPVDIGFFGSVAHVS